MIDFKINEIGDIDLAFAEQYPSFVINFYVPQQGNTNIRYPAFRIDIDTDVLRYDTKYNGLRIDFETKRTIGNEYKINARAIYNKEELAQEILIRLKTELGEFSYISFLGSELVLERHEDIRSSVVQEQVRQHVISAIADITFEEEPDVSVEWIDDTSRFRYETLRITIDTGRTNIYTGTV